MKIKDLLFTLILSLTTASKLNVPRILLPFAEEKTSFTLKSNDGCFRWKASRPEFVVITPLIAGDEENCYSSVSISRNPNHKSWSKSQTVILAEDVKTPGLFLRCDVILDVITSLQIVTKTHEIYLEEAPEEFEVRAYDSEGNEFSTLRNIIFKWHLENKKNSGGSIIRFINFRDNPYSIEDELRKIEEEGKQGYKVLLEGIKTGSTKVSVVMESSFYRERVPNVSTRLVVVANLFLIPHSALILIGSDISYHAEQMKGNQIHQISLPSSEYSLKIEDESIAIFENENTVVGSKVGVTFLSLVDHNTDVESGVKFPTSELRVGVPEFISISIPPHNNPRLTVGSRTDFLLEVFHHDHQKFDVGSTTLVYELSVSNPELFVILSQNGSSFIGKPLKSGSVTIKTNLKGVTNIRGHFIPLEQPLKSKLQLEIFDAILLEPSVTYIPWNPKQNSSYSINYFVSGYDSSSLIWSSENTSLVSVNQIGIASTAGGFGSTKIRATMKQAAHNMGFATIFVEPVGGLQILRQTSVEVLIGDNLEIPIAFFTQTTQTTKFYFSDCHELAFESHLSDGVILEKGNVVSKKIQRSSACSYLTLKGKAPGFTKLTVSYRQGLLEFRDEIHLASYAPLRPLQSSHLVLIDSSVIVTWIGGPAPWVKQPESHFHKLSTSGHIRIKEISQNAPQSFVYEITCLSEGLDVLTLTVGNMASSSADLLFPINASSSIDILCEKPFTIELLPILPFQKESLCPLTGVHYALNYLSLDLSVRVLNKEGRKFENISKLDIELNVSDESFVSLKNNTLIPKGEGLVTVSALLRIPFSIFSNADLSDSITIHFVEDAVFSSSSLHLFHHPKNTEKKLQVFRGSGHFDFTVSSDAIALEYDHERVLSILPIHVGDALLSLIDLCLPNSRESTASVTVRGISRVELLMEDRVKLSKSIPVFVNVYTDDNSRLEIDEWSFIDVSLTSSIGNTVRILSENGSFSLKGVSLGDTNIIATVSSLASDSITSQPQTLQVYPPFRLKPKNITIVIGAQFQVEITGGPRGISFQFNTGDKGIASTNQIGLIKGLSLGTTKLIAKSIDKNTDNEDFVMVHVVEFKGFKITTPLTVCLVGTALPLSASGLDEKNQILTSYGTGSPAFDFKWSLIGEAGELRNVFYEYGIKDLAGPNLGTLHFKALFPGKVTVQLSVTGPFLKWNTEKDIIVLDQLNFVSPSISHFPPRLLLSPYSFYQLQSNTYNSGNDNYNLLHCDDEENRIQLSSSGAIKSLGTVNSCSVLLSSFSENHQKQSILLIIEVKPISYLMIQFKNENQSYNLGKGLRIPYRVSYHDSSGCVFDGVKDSTINLRPSRLDSLLEHESYLEILKDTIPTVLCATNTELNILANCVTFQISPYNVSLPKKMRVGDIFPLNDPYPLGIWTVDPKESISFIQDERGNNYAQCLQSGEVKLSYGLGKEGGEISWSGNIKEPEPFFFLTPSFPLNDHQSIQNVKLSSNNQSFLLSSSSSSTYLSLTQFPFSCSVSGRENKDVSSTFNSKASFSQGFYVCSLLLTQETKTIKGNDVLTIFFVSPFGNTQIDIPFYSSFKVLESACVLDEDDFCHISFSGTSAVLESLLITSSPKTCRQYLDISEGIAYEDTSHNRRFSIYYKRKSTSEDCNLVVTSILTSQKMTLPILVNPPCFQIKLSTVLFTFAKNYYINILFFIFSFLFCIIASRLMMQYPSHVGQSKILSSNSSPPVGASSINNTSETSLLKSPLLNANRQPYLWTVDNSPIYGSSSPPRSLARQYM